MPAIYEFHLTVSEDEIDGQGHVNNLEYLSSAGLRVILTAAKLLQAAAGEMKICQANGVVKDVLEMSGFDSLVHMYDDEKDAVAAFSG